MGNILAFLSKYHRFFLFILLELFSLYLVVSYNANPNKAWTSWTNEMSGQANKYYNDLNYYFHLKQVNDSLLQENTRLHNHSIAAMKISPKREITVRDTIYRQQYVYIPGKVVNNSVSFRNNYITLDVGSNRGVTKHMGVVTTAGVVGITRAVSPNFTSTFSVLHQSFTLSAEIKELQEVGSLMWDGNDAEVMVLKNIPSYITIKKGMHVVTSPFSQIFPQGTPIGIIKDYEVKPGEAFYTIYVKLAANMRNIRQVYVIKNILREEQDSLEATQEVEVQ